MTSSRKKLFINQSVGLSVEVTNRRLKKAGVILEQDLGLHRAAPPPRSTTYRTQVTKKLAGG